MVNSHVNLDVKMCVNDNNYFTKVEPHDQNISQWMQK